MDFPPPIWLLVLFAGIAGGVGGRVFTYTAKRIGGPSGYIAGYLMMGVITSAGVLASWPVWMWMISPVAVVLDDGATGFGRWQVDDRGSGQVEVTAGGITCRESYNALDPSRYTESAFSCEGRVTGVLRIIRDGTRGRLTEGEGVLRLRDGDGNMRYGWYVFGPRARLAVLTDGRLGMPDGVADKAAFERIAEAGRTLASR